MAEETEMVKYVIERNTETIMVEVPKSWKVTWGPAAPGQKPHFLDEENRGYTLRFYESEKAQRAVWSGVKSFRLATIPVQRHVRKVKGSTEWSSDPNFSKYESEEEIEERWEDLPF